MYFHAQCAAGVAAAPHQESYPSVRQVWPRHHITLSCRRHRNLSHRDWPRALFSRGCGRSTTLHFRAAGVAIAHRDWPRDCSELGGVQGALGGARIALRAHSGRARRCMRARSLRIFQTLVSQAFRDPRGIAECGTSHFHLTSFTVMALHYIRPSQVSKERPGAHERALPGAHERSTLVDQ